MNKAVVIGKLMLIRDSVWFSHSPDDRRALEIAIELVRDIDADDPAFTEGE